MSNGIKHNESSEPGLGHLAFFGLRVNPFPVTPAEDIFLTPAIAQIIAELTHGVLARKGFMVLTGEIGLGKTTISRKILEQLIHLDIHTALILQPYPDPLELLHAIRRDFAFAGGEAGNLTGALDALNSALLLENNQGRNCAIIIDDAQNLNHQCLEVVRMISNLETGDRKLVQILLVGQPELYEKLKTHELRQLKSRIVIFKEVLALSLEELGDYLASRFRLAEGHYLSVESKAVRELYGLSRGNLRRVNLLMDRALYAAFAEESLRITRAMIREAAGDLMAPESETAMGGMRPFFRMLPTMLTMGLATGTVLFCLSRGIPLLMEGIYPQPVVEETAEPPTGRGASEPGVAGAGRAGGASLGVAGELGEREAPPATSEPHPSARRSGEDAARLGNMTAATGDLVPESGNPPSPEGASGREPSATGPVPEDITAFLDAYGLRGYARSFLAAQETAGLPRLAQRIYRETGLQMVMLQAPLPAAAARFDLLGIGGGDDGREPDRFFLFWKPRLRFDHFREGMAGREVTLLKERLVRPGCYPAGPASPATPHPSLTEALLAYQAARGLPRTGVPDALTLFMLEHEEADGGRKGEGAGCGPAPAATPVAMATEKRES